MLKQVKAEEKGRLVGYSGLREYMRELEREGELHTLTAEVDWDEEIGAITRRSIETRGPAVLFTNIKGYGPEYRVLGIPLGPGQPSIQSRVAIAMGLPKQTPARDLVRIYRQRMDTPIEPVVVGAKDSPCKEIVLKGDDVDLYRFPTPKIHAADGGRYIGSWDIVVTKDSQTDWVNWGMYRSMIHDKRHLGILLIPSEQHGGAIWRQYESQGKAMPIAIVIGADPACHMAAITSLDPGQSEVAFAGSLLGEPVRLVKCETSDLQVPAEAEIVIEGEVLPGERKMEGPFGEYTGHYTHSGPSPVIRVNCITQRRDPILTVANMGKPWDDGAVPMSVTTAAPVLKMLQDRGFPVKGVFQFAPPSCFVVSVTPRAGMISKIVATMLAGSRTALAGSGIVFVDEDVNETSLEDVWWAITTRMHPKHGYYTVDNVPANPLSPFVTPEDRETHETSLFVMNATLPPHWSKEYRDAHTHAVDFERGWSQDVQRKVLDRWTKDYGFKT